MAKYSNYLFKFDLLILSVLQEQDRYGYEISKQIKALSNEKYIMKETTLYSAFTRMEKNGYITLRDLFGIIQDVVNKYFCNAFG